MTYKHRTCLKKTRKEEQGRGILCNSSVTFRPQHPCDVVMKTMSGSLLLEMLILRRDMRNIKNKTLRNLMILDRVLTVCFDNPDKMCEEIMSKAREEFLKVSDRKDYKSWMEFIISHPEFVAEAMGWSEKTTSDYMKTIREIKEIDEWF